MYGIDGSQNSRTSCKTSENIVKCQKYNTSFIYSKNLQIGVYRADFGPGPYVWHSCSNTNDPGCRGSQQGSSRPRGGAARAVSRSTYPVATSPHFTEYDATAWKSVKVFSWRPTETVSWMKSGIKCISASVLVTRLLSCRGFYSKRWLRAFRPTYLNVFVFLFVFLCDAKMCAFRGKMREAALLLTHCLLVCLLLSSSQAARQGQDLRCGGE